LHCIFEGRFIWGSLFHTNGHAEINNPSIRGAARNVEAVGPGLYYMMIWLLVGVWEAQPTPSHIAGNVKWSIFRRSSVTAVGVFSQPHGLCEINPHAVTVQRLPGQIRMNGRHRLAI
jgi:hypothetical protein